MSAIASRSTVDTEFSACSVELAPFDASLLVCGTYQIVKDETATIIDEASPPTKRLGRLLLFDVDEEAHLCVYPGPFRAVN